MAVAPMHEPVALDELGWRQFFDLCAAVLELDAGVRAASWLGEDDRDWHVIVQSGLELAGVALRGPCYVRAVWVPDLSWRSRAEALEEQLGSLRDALGRAEWAGSVAVLTNYAGVFSDRSRMPELFGLDQAVLLGPAWLSARIDASAGLRRCMPSLLGMGELERWVPDGVRAKSTLDLAAARELSFVFLPTSAYSRALAVLRAHSFTVLTGPPEMGKTSIARMIALALMTDGWQAFECTAPEQIVDAYDAAGPQVFVADDAFGSTEYRPEAAERWAREMERLLRMMDGRHWLIWTSRPAPLRAGLGRIHRERGAERFPRPGEVLVDASALSLDEKVLILLRHAKASSPQPVRQGLRRVGYTIVSHPHFTPERIRRLAATNARTLAGIDENELDAIVERQIQTPTEAMTASFGALSEEHQSLLFALLDAPPGPVEERELARVARRHRPEGLSRTPMELVDRLTDHFLRVSETLRVEWVHPSWRDLVIDRLRDDAPAREAFLQRCTLEGMMLAISTAGGPTGARRLGLLLSDRDWDLVTDQILRAMRETDDVQVTRVLDSLVITVAHTAMVGGRHHGEACALATAALKAAVRRWDDAWEPIGLDVLTAWFTLAGRVPEPIDPPELGHTWTELLPSETTDLRRSVDLDRAIAWLALAELLEEHAPDELFAFSFPERHQGRLGTLLGQAGALRSSETSDAVRERLARFFRLARGYGGEAPLTRAHFDELIWWAEHEHERHTRTEATPFTDASTRRHVERVLQDL